MLSRLTRFWWVLVLRGIVSIVFALFAFLNPKIAFEALILLLGVFLLADGATPVIVDCGFDLAGGLVEVVPTAWLAGSMVARTENSSLPFALGNM